MLIVKHFRMMFSYLLTVFSLLFFAFPVSAGEEKCKPWPVFPDAEYYAYSIAAYQYPDGSIHHFFEIGNKGPHLSAVYMPEFAKNLTYVPKLSSTASYVSVSGGLIAKGAPGKKYAVRLPRTFVVSMARATEILETYRNFYKDSDLKDLYDNFYNFAQLPDDLSNQLVKHLNTTILGYIPMVFLEGQGGYADPSRQNWYVPTGVIFIPVIPAKQKVCIPDDAVIVGQFDGSGGLGQNSADPSANSSPNEQITRKSRPWFYYIVLVLVLLTLTAARFLPFPIPFFRVVNVSVELQPSYNSAKAVISRDSRGPREVKVEFVCVSPSTRITQEIILPKNASRTVEIPAGELVTAKIRTPNWKNVSKKTFARLYFKNGGVDKEWSG